MAINNSLDSPFPLSPAKGGTGVNNSTFTLTVSANSSINQNVTTIGDPTFHTVSTTTDVIASGAVDADNVFASSYISCLGPIYGSCTFGLLDNSATAGGTTTLDNTDNEFQYFTGTLNQTLILPVSSTLAGLGQTFQIINASSGIVTVQSSGASTLQAMAPNTKLIAILIAKGGTGTNQWTWSYAALTLTPGSVGFNYVSVSGTTQTASAGTSYILNNAGATTVTLPTSASSTIGDTIKIKGRSSAPWIIQASTSQIITYGATQSTSAGTATSALGSDSLQLVYVASNEWSIDWAVSSLITLA